MNFYQNRYYRLNKFLLSCVGQWPFQSRKERYFLRTFTVLIVSSLVIPEVLVIQEVTGDIKRLSRALIGLGFHFRSGVKFVNGIVKANTMKKLTVNIEETWIAKSADFEQALLRRYAERGKIISVIYTVYIYTALFLYFSLPIIPMLMDIYVPLNESRQKIQLYETEYFVDQEKNYFYILLHAYVTMPVSFGVIVSYDIMFAVYVQHNCCIFAILGARLESLRKSTDRKNLQANAVSVENGNETYAYIVDCIKIHKEAVEYAKLLEASGTECYVFILGTSMVAITFSGVMLARNLHDPGEVLTFLPLVFGEILHMYALCWQGHTLVEHSEHVFIDAYNCDWYDLPTSSKKLLISIMMVSMEPCKLSAGKVFVLSMESFAAALKTSMSYFTVLLSVQ